MKKIASLAVLMLLVAGAAFAQPGVNLGWNDCVGQGGVIDKTQTCTNSGTIVNNTYTSFVLPATIGALGSSDAISDIQVDSAALPTWWTQGATRFGGSPGASTCPGWFDGAPNGPVPFGPNIVQSKTNGLKIRMVVVVAAGEELPADPAVEYLADIVNLKYGAGTFNNAGCLTPACWVLNQVTLIDLTNPANPVNTVLTNPSTSNFVTWRAAGTVPCPAATPAKKATWGSIKALYR